MEDNSLATFRLHRKHLTRILNGRTPAAGLKTTDLQRYVNERSKERFRDTPIKPRTVKKEVATFRAVWNWGRLHDVVAGDAPTRGLRYAKEDDAPGFMTWEQVERRVSRGGSPDLWDSLFLDAGQISACLDHVRAAAVVPFAYPMLAFVAYTGARRSEALRSRVEDFDFETGKVRIREKKRNRKVKETQRVVKMAPKLEELMREWMANHPGGPHTFCQTDVLARRRTRSRTTGHQSGPGRATTTAGRRATVRERTDRPGPAPVSKSEASYYFKRALADSRWAVVRGFHVFRHSLASNLAAKGVRQEVIEGIMGHQTEEMRKRYRHLFPTETESAVQKVFGG